METITCVVVVQVSPVNLQLDMSLYDSLQEFKAQWQDENVDPSSCKQLRQDFLNRHLSKQTLMTLKVNVNLSYLNYLQNQIEMVWQCVHD